MKTKYLIKSTQSFKNRKNGNPDFFIQYNYLSSKNYLMSQMNKIFLMVTLFMYIVAVMVISKTVVEKYSVTLQNVIEKKVTND